MGFWLKVISYGQDKTKPFTGVREVINRNFYQFMMSVIVFFSFMKVTFKHHNVDYSEYLGTNYKSTQKLPAKTSTIVVNH